MTTALFLPRAGTQLTPASWQLPDGVSPYLEPPTIPEGMTIAEYRRSRRQRRYPLLPPLLDWLSQLVSAPQGSLA